MTTSFRRHETVTRAQSILSPLLTPSATRAAPSYAPGDDRWEGARRDEAAVTQTALPTRNLDVLRAVAVSCVLVSHTLIARDVATPWYGREKLGRLGVLLFFVHTSLVLMSSLERQGRTRDGWLRTFYTRRAFRIYPLAIATIALVVVCRIPVHVVLPPLPATAIAARTLLANVALVQNLTGDPNLLQVLWSLPVEVQMYALLPFLYLVALRRSRYMVLMVLASVVLGWLALRFQLASVTRLAVLTFAPCFATGVLAFHLLRRGVRPKLAPWLWPIAIVAVSSMVFYLDPTFSHPEPGLLPVVLLALCIPFIRDAQSSALTTIANRICEISYGIYLLHEPILWFAFVVLRGIPVGVQWLVFGTLLAVLPTLAYVCIERPGIRLGRTITKRRESHATMIG